VHSSLYRLEEIILNICKKIWLESVEHAGVLVNSGTSAPLTLSWLARWDEFVTLRVIVKVVI